MAEVFNNLLVSCPNGGGLFLLRRGIAHALDHLDTTGLAVHERQILRALQPSQLLQIGRAGGNSYSAKDVGDIHDVLWDEGCFYAVATERNEILKLDEQGGERQRWTFPGEADSWHINCLARWGRRVIFSAFSDRAGHQEYKSPPLEVGFVQDLHSEERLISGLFQPHSLLQSGENLLLANSGAFEIHEYDATCQLRRKLQLDGYTRGIARSGRFVYVGLSKSRNVSAGNLERATLVALDADTWEEVGRIALPVDEIYAVQCLRAPDVIDVLARVSSHTSKWLAEKVAARELEFARAESDRSTLRSEIYRLGGELAESDHDSETLRSELERIKEELAKAEKARTAIINDLHRLQSELNQCEHERVSLRRDVEQMGGELAQGKRQRAELQRSLEQTKSEFELSERERIKLREEIYRIGGELAQREHERLMLGKDVERLEGELARTQELSAMLRQRDAELAASAAEREAKDAQIRRLIQRLNDKDERLRLSKELGRARDLKLQEQGEMLKEAESRVREMEDLQHRAEAQMQSLRTAIFDRDDRIEQLAKRLDDLAGEISARDHAIAEILSSNSWRITRPLRAISHSVTRSVQPFRKGRHAFRTICRTLGDAELRARYVAALKVLGFREASRRVMPYLRRGGPRTLDEIPTPLFDIRADMGRRAVILTTHHCDFVASSVQRALAQIGVESKIIHEQPSAGYEEVPHFVICPQMFQQLPSLYVAVQMEQSVSTRWFTEDYLRILENSFAILDYSVANIDALAKLGLHRRQFFYMPLGYLPDFGLAQKAPEGKYDVVFYGDIKNERRQRFIDALGKVCRIKVINDFFGEALHAEMAKAKLIVNIHYYEGALLETTRLWECVSLGKLVVSERAVNMEENGDLEQLVDFVDLNDVDGMVARVRYWLDNDRDRVKRIKANRKLARELPNRFEYFFYRFLLAHDCITFFRFWQLAGNRLKLSGDKLCLNLPEYSVRRRSFEQDNRYGFAVFPGLRHHEGWVGCGMSYKLMIMLASKQGLPRLTICEDDVEFRADFEHEFQLVLDELDSSKVRWNVFSGLLADLHSDAVISDVCDFHGQKIVRTDRLISMVFNVYHRRTFSRVALWDERDRDVVSNAIDRYLERTKLTVLARYPFLVGHKSHLHSTLWGIQNGEMDPMIRRSEELLEKKIEEFVLATKTPVA